MDCSDVIIRKSCTCPEGRYRLYTSSNLHFLQVCNSKANSSTTIVSSLSRPIRGGNRGFQSEGSSEMGNNREHGELLLGEEAVFITIEVTIVKAL
jgi:hypothetical protein